jgi:hypothetical protein
VGVQVFAIHALAAWHALQGSRAADLVSRQMVSDDVDPNSYNVINHKSFTINDARVAKLADAPDLGFQNRRFQNVPFRFKKQSIYEGKA